MELVPLKCSKCGEEFLTLLKEGEVVCPKCGTTDYITIEKG
jgi:DNA-directed RNA polymerase subunit RPC12/RpoP